MVKSAAKKEVIELLNDVLCAELTAINQYFLHAKLRFHWGYTTLANVARAQSIGEMKHAEIVSARILFLDGMPNMQKLGKILVGESVAEQMKLDAKLEADAINRLNQGVDLCLKHNDNGTRMILETILASEEEHLDWLEQQIQLINNLGEANYLAQKISADAPA